LTEEQRQIKEQSQLNNLKQWQQSEFRYNLIMHM